MAQTHSENSPDADAYLAAIVASARDGIISTDLDGVIQTWNPAAHRILGYAASEVIGKNISILIPESAIEEHDRVTVAIQRGQDFEPWRTVRIRKDGRRIVVSMNMSPIHDEAGHIVGVSRIIRDLTAKAEQDEYLASIVASSDDAIISKSIDGIIRSWNRGAEKIFGYSADEMIGQTMLTLMPAGRESEEAAILGRLARGERVDHFQTLRRHKDGHLIDVSVTISPIYGPDGAVIGASKVARDITAFKQLARERERLLASEQAARQEAVQANRAKDEFLATLSHELRTPLNAIMGWAQILQLTPPSGDDLNRAMETIERNARAQTRLIDDLLDMSRIVSGQLLLDVETIDLQEMLRGSLESARPIAEPQGVTLEADIDDEPINIRGDATRLQQVVWNLISNAMRHTPRGGTVTVSLDRTDDRIRIAVADTGQGIPQDFLPRLFNRFTQADGSATRRHGGLGLGLAIVRHLVEMHGGSVQADSPGEGQGATFTVELPFEHEFSDRQPNLLEQQMKSVVPSSRSIGIDLRGVRILVVDDEDDTRVLVRRLLEAAGARVSTAASANHALDVLKRERPHVLITDISMPEHDGYELLTRVRQLPDDQGGTIPALALTAYAGAEHRKRALATGFQAHITKPVDAIELLSIVGNAIGHHSVHIP